MKLFKNKKFFSDNNNYISFYKDYWDNIFLNADVCFLTDKFLEYQKDLFNEFISDISEKLSYHQDFTIRQLQSDIEEKLQIMNSKLNTFSEKIHDVEKFDIRWNIQIFFQDTYMSSMIWDVSTVIFRDNKVNYIVDNDMDWVEKIDVFSEFIEWELEHSDKILCIGSKISDIMDKSDLQDIIDWDVDNVDVVFDKFFETIKIRVPNETMCFSSLFSVEFDVIIKKDDIKKTVYNNLKYVKTAKEVIVNYKYPITISIWFIVVIFLVYSLVSSFITSDRDNIVDTPAWQVVIDFTIDDLRKEIDLFRRMPVSSDEKVRKYQEILAKLDLLDQRWRWTHNVQELRQILDEEYLKWFNIVSVSNISNDYVYTFDWSEKEVLWVPKSISYANWINIWGTNWVVLRAISNETRWTSIPLSLPVDMSWCTNNLIWDWLYCFSKEWDIINVTRSWVVSVTTAAWWFNKNISWIWTFWSSNFYTIFNDEERMSEGVFIARYINNPWSQNSFWLPQYYNVNETFLENNSGMFASWFTNISIDWSFLSWSPTAKEIVQFHREWTTNVLNARTIRTSWWADIVNNKWEDVDVLSYAWSRLVYTLDKSNNVFTVFGSAPFKTNTSYTMSYNLEYQFSIRFDKNIEIIWAYVQDWEVPILYVLTTDWVARYNISNIRNSFWM